MDPLACNTGQMTRVGQNRILESLIGYYTVLYPYNTYYLRIPYVLEKWNPSELNDKGAIVQLLKSWICVPNLVVQKNQGLGSCASSKCIIMV